MAAIALQAANDNDLGRDVVIHMPEPSKEQMAVLADIFTALFDEAPDAANDNGPVLTQQGC